MKSMITLLAGAAALMHPLAVPAQTPEADDHEVIGTISRNDFTLSYQVFGPEQGRPLLLIAGTGMQLIEWPREIVEGLVRQGYRVITYDHRDAGRSTHFTQWGAPDWPALMAALAAGRAPPLPYNADDMAKDAIALLDALDITRADLLGISGGATIATIIAAEQPDRVRALHLIAANSGNPAIAMPADPARFASVAQPEPADTRADLVAKRMAMRRALAGRDEPAAEERMRALVERAIARDPDPLGYARQGAAILAVGDLRPRLATIKAPTLVAHGAEDPLVSHQAGRDVAAAISGATFLLVGGMGHELQPGHIPPILDAVRVNANRAR